MLKLYKSLYVGLIVVWAIFTISTLIFRTDYYSEKDGLLVLLGVHTLFLMAYIFVFELLKKTEEKIAINREKEISHPRLTDALLVFEKLIANTHQDQLNKDWSGQSNNYNKYSRYHLNRVRCYYYRISKAMLTHKNGNVYLKDEKQWKKLRRLFWHPIILEKLLNKFIKYKKEPAGGWALVFEQRDFLKKELVEIFKTYKKGTTVKLLEAGCASYIHHFSYLQIIFEALMLSKNGINVELTVLDIYLFPLYQIYVVGKEIDNKSLSTRKIKSHFMPSFNIDKRFRTFVNEELDIQTLKKVKVRLFEWDLTAIDKEEINSLKFDIITEHFLSPYNNTNANYENWKRIRENYQHFCQTKLHLIAATGSPTKDKTFDYFELHRKLCFQELVRKRVWDPYDLNKAAFRTIKKGSKIEQQNYLMHWVYEKI